jgi:hypothetical protein
VRGLTPVRERPLETTIARPRTAEPDPEPHAAPVAGGRRRWPVLVAAGALVVVAAVVTISLVATAGGSPEPTASPTGTGTSAIVGDAPTPPKLVSAAPSADGTSVTFRFAPVTDADGYRWAPSEQPDARTVVKDPVVVRTGVAPGQRVCVQVSTIIHGRTSDPTEACYP